MTRPVPIQPQVLAYAANEDASDRAVRRACAAAMMAAGVTQLAGFLREGYFGLAYVGFDGIGEAWDLLSTLAMAKGLSFFAVLVAGFLLWRGRGRPLAAWALAAWALTGIATLVLEQVDDVLTGAGPDNAGETVYFVSEVLSESTPLVLPMLLWWIVVRTPASGGVVR